MDLVEHGINNQKPGSEQVIDLISIAKLIIRRKRVFIITIILCTLVGILYVCIKKPQYEYKQPIQLATYLSSPELANVQPETFQSVDRIIQLTKDIYLPNGIKKLNQSLLSDDYISRKMVDVDIVASNGQMKSKKSNFVVLTAKGTRQDKNKFEKLFNMVLTDIQKDEAKIVLQSKKIFSTQLASARNHLAYLDNNKKILNKELMTNQRDMQEPNAMQNAIIQNNILTRIQQDSNEYFSYKTMLNEARIKLNSIQESSYLSPMIALRSMGDISKRLVVLFSLIFGVMLGLFMVFLFEFVGEVKSR